MPWPVHLVAIEPAPESVRRYFPGAHQVRPACYTLGPSAARLTTALAQVECPRCDRSPTAGTRRLALARGRVHPANERWRR